MNGDERLVDLGAVAPLESIESGPTGGLFSTVVPDGWQQGRGAFGGLTIGLMARAVERLESPTERPLRSVNATLGGALRPGPAQLKVTEQRRGRALSTWSVTVIQEGTVVASALTVHGLSRSAIELPSTLVAPAEVAHDWNALPVSPVEPPFAPNFARFFEFRNTGPAPFMRASHARTAGWIRPRVEHRLHDTAELIALSDAWWPSIFSAMDAMTPMATVSFQWSRHATSAGDAPLYHEGRVLGAGDGFFSEERVLFSADGRLVALNHQTMAMG